MYFVCIPTYSSLLSSAQVFVQVCGVTEGLNTVVLTPSMGAGHWVLLYVFSLSLTVLPYTRITHKHTHMGSERLQTDSWAFSFRNLNDNFNLTFMFYRTHYSANTVQGSRLSETWARCWSLKKHAARNARVHTRPGLLFVLWYQFIPNQSKIDSRNWVDSLSAGESIQNRITF